jgi:hypothetical protein
MKPVRATAMSLKAYAFQAIYFSLGATDSALARTTLNRF